MRAWLEFHDSTLVAVRQVGTVVEITLDAYVHRWERIDGKWLGTGWMQPVRVDVYAAGLSTSTPTSPCEIGTGAVTVGPVAYDNVTPLPLTLAGPVEIRLELHDGARLGVRGERIEIVTTGEGHRVEGLPDEMLPPELA